MRTLALIVTLIGLEATALAQLSPGTDAGSTELAELGTLLTRWTERDDWPRLEQREGLHQLGVALPSDPTPEISSRLALFRTRFDRLPRQCRGWPEFAQLAERAHERLLSEYPVPVDDAEPGGAWFEPGWVAARALLLDVGGHSEEARALLFGDGERTWPGCCQPCLSESLFVIARARAEFLDRSGDSIGALRWLHEAWYQNGADELAAIFGRPRDVRGLMSARYAILLAEEDELDAAAGVMRSLEDGSSTALGLLVARAALGEQLAATTTSRAAVFALPLHDGTRSDHYGVGMAFVIGDESDATTWQLIACRLPKRSELGLRQRLRPDHSEDLVVLAPDDSLVRPYIETCVNQPAAWRWVPALEALRALGQPIRQRLIACLEQTDVHDPISRWPSTAEQIDRTARRLCGDGPALECPPQSLTIDQVRDAWLAWLSR